MHTHPDYPYTRRTDAIISGTANPKSSQLDHGISQTIDGKQKMVIFGFLQVFLQKFFKYFVTNVERTWR